MRLSKIFRGYSEKLSVTSSDQEITSIASDSRKVKPGCLFVAIAGVASDGHRYLDQAAEKGAAAFVVLKGRATDSNQLEVKDTRDFLAFAASRLYGNDSDGIELFGVTGTAGKSTTTIILKSVLEALGKRVGLLGTVENRFEDRVWKTELTTPGPIELNKIISEMKSLGADAVVMEVSSHALDQRRVDYIPFAGVIFTNLSQDHLDYHKGMEDYFEAKRRLFTDFGSELTRVSNIEDSHGKRLIEEGVAQGFDVPETWAIDQKGISGAVGKFPFHSTLMGRFNAENIAAIAKLAELEKWDVKSVCKGIERIDVIPGRMERVIPESGMQLLVDYAHKPGALESVLKTIGAMKGRGEKVVTVVGCGGDRDREKRPVMARIALQYSDFTIFTSDNPRTEDPEKIIDEMLAGAKRNGNFERIVDRRQAIQASLKHLSPGDWLLVAGKGHEDYQILGTQKVHFDDREEIVKAVSQINRES